MEMDMNYEKKEALAKLGISEEKYLSIGTMKYPSPSEIIGRLLEKSGYTVKVLAEQLNTDRPNLNNSINGKRNFTREVLIRLCVCLGATAELTDYILDLSEYERLRDWDKFDAVAKMVLESKSCLDGFERLYCFDVLREKKCHL